MEKCFAMKAGECIALNDDSVCENCPFYKGKKENKSDCEAVYEHLRSLPAEQQIYIAAKYYKKKIPWAADVV